MSERLIRVGATLSAAVVLGLGAIGCGGESDNNNDKIIALCKETRIDPEVKLELAELALADVSAISDKFKSRGVKGSWFWTTGVTCDREMAKSELNTASSFVSVQGFGQPCLSVNLVPKSMDELTNTSPPVSPTSSNTLFVVCPATK